MLNTIRLAPLVLGMSLALVGCDKNEPTRPPSTTAATATAPAQQAADRGGAGGKELIVDLGSEVTMTLVPIPAGTFLMGSPVNEEDRFDNETLHKVILTRGFYMGATTVAQAQWKAVMGNNPSHFKGDDLPVEGVSWDDATAFCQTLSERERKSYGLPTEAQWEYACRAGTTGACYAKEDETALAKAAWYKGNSDGKTHTVGMKKANAWGLYDMHGNVLQWCSDWHSEYPAGEVTDPTGPATGMLRTLRGCAWVNDARYCRAAHRYGYSPNYRDNLGFVGFRVVLNMSE